MPHEPLLSGRHSEEPECEQRAAHHLLLSIYCCEQHEEKVSIQGVRELRMQIQNEARKLDNRFPGRHDLNEHDPSSVNGKT